jgi:phenylpropionate dioxygenase-like ring-hydroxylating dioxygenase large terminal subunit
MGINCMLDRYWYIACRSKVLRKKPLGIRIMGTNLVLFRAAQKGVAALEDRCAHRGSPLSRGSVCGEALQCPYHGWRYDTDGRLLQVPALVETAELPDISPRRCYPCVEQDGYVWVSLHHEPVAAVPLRLPNIDTAGWTSFHLQTRFAAPLEACLENFLDCPHATFVHRGWFRSPTSRTVKVQLRVRDDGAEVEYFHEPREKSLVWWLLSPFNTQMKHTDRFIAPNISRVDYEFSNGFHYIITSVCTPLSRDDTLVHTTISFHCGKIGKLIRLYFEPLSRIIIRQDVAMLNAMQENIDRFEQAEFTSSEADLLATEIRRWRQAIRKGESLPSEKTVREYEIRL